MNLRMMLCRIGIHVDRPVKQWEVDGKPVRGKRCPICGKIEVVKK